MPDHKSHSTKDTHSATPSQYQIKIKATHSSSQGPTPSPSS